jgi:hypothetical protein
MTEKTNIEQIKNKIKEIMSTNIREYRHHSLIVGEESFGGGGGNSTFFFTVGTSSPLKKVLRTHQTARCHNKEVCIKRVCLSVRPNISPSELLD